MIDKTHNIRLANGNLYLDYGVYQTFFPGVDNIILLERSPQILIMPVLQQGTGGLLLKIRNSNGDRVVNVAEFFQFQGVDINKELIVPVQWSTEYSALTFVI